MEERRLLEKGRKTWRKEYNIVVMLVKVEEEDRKEQKTWRE